IPLLVSVSSVLRPFLPRLFVLLVYHILHLPPLHFFFFLLLRRPPKFTLFPYTTLFRSLYKSYVWSYISSLNYCIKWILNEKEHRSEEHTSELQSRFDLVCRLLLEKKKATC